MNLLKFFVVSAVVFLASCQTANPLNKTTYNSNAASLADRLKKLPAVETVEDWNGDFAGGLIITTYNYKIYTTINDPLMLEKIPGFVEAAYLAYQSQLPSPISTSSKFTVYLFAQRSQWQDFTKTFAGELAPLYFKIRAGAYYLNGATVAYNIGLTKTFSVLAHEGWHQFNSRHFRYRLPSWLDEGIATLFEASQTQNGITKFDPQQNLNRLGALKITAAKGRLMTIEQLIALNPSEVIVENDDSVMAFYAQSYALVRFLREENYGQRLGRYHQMLLGGANGTWPIDESARVVAADRNIPLTVYWNKYVAAKLFEMYISNDLEEIQKEYAAFCNKITYHVHFKK